MANTFKLHQVSKLSGQAIFFDANVLIYIFWPTGSISWEANYSKAFNELLKQKNTLFLDFRVVSEIVNRVVKIEFEKFSKFSSPANQTVKFKQFRNSVDGHQTLCDIYLILKNNILPYFQVVGKTFNKLEIEALLMVDSLDFADKAVVETCVENNLVLFTNDIDFKTTQLTILSGNPNY